MNTKQNERIEAVLSVLDSVQLLLRGQEFAGRLVASGWCELTAVWEEIRGAAAVPAVTEAPVESKPVKRGRPRKPKGAEQTALVKNADGSFRFADVETPYPVAPVTGGEP